MLSIKPPESNPLASESGSSNSLKPTIKAEPIQQAPAINPKTQLMNYYKNEVLVGLIVAFVLVTQEVAYAFIAKIDPSFAIHSAWIVGITTAIFGGRPGMINGLTGGLASIIAPFITKKGPGGGIEFLFPSTLLAGGLILLCGIAKVGRLKNMLPSPVKIGFCNGLSIIIGKKKKKINVFVLFFVIFIIYAILKISLIFFGFFQYNEHVFFFLLAIFSLFFFRLLSMN
jgi:hypothetical protein